MSPSLSLAFDRGSKEFLKMQNLMFIEKELILNMFAMSMSFTSSSRLRTKRAVTALQVQFKGRGRWRPRCHFHFFIFQTWDFGKHGL